MRMIQTCLVVMTLLASVQGFAQTQQPDGHVGQWQSYAGHKSQGHAGRFQWWHDFRHEFDSHCRRVNAWPHPFALEDRALHHLDLRAQSMICFVKWDLEGVTKLGL